MAKKRTTVSLDEDVADYVSQSHINTSGLVNDLLRTHMEGGDVDSAIRRMRREQVKAEIQSMQSQLEQKKSELERLGEMDAEANEIGDDELAKIRQVPQDTNHPLIQDIAERNDMTPEEAIEEAYE